MIVEKPTMTSKSIRIHDGDQESSNNKQAYDLSNTSKKNLDILDLTQHGETLVINYKENKLFPSTQKIYATTFCACGIHQGQTQFWVTM